MLDKDLLQDAERIEREQARRDSRRKTLAKRAKVDEKRRKKHELAIAKRDRDDCPWNQTKPGMFDRIYRGKRLRVINDGQLFRAYVDGKFARGDQHAATGLTIQAAQRTAESAAEKGKLIW